LKEVDKSWNVKSMLLNITKLASQECDCGGSWRKTLNAVQRG